MPKISQEQISDILNKVDIVDLIGETVSLSKKGKSYFGLCPFHSEKTPSFSVNPDLKIYHCFSCGEKGNAITFLEKTKNLSFMEALDELAKRANVELDTTHYKKEDPNERLYKINEDATQFYRLLLENTKAGHEAKEYLHSRGITDEIIRKFSIGLAPDDFNLLTKTLTDRGYLLSDLHDLGLVKKNEKEQFYDLFRRRIIIPIKDKKSRTIAFSGRIYKEKDKDSPKYINSPQTIVFTKSNVLYNFDKAIGAIQQNNRVVLFEGYMDVIAGVRSGILESVASMGTSLTKQQVLLLSKHTKNITICYDGDPAGIEATSRAINLLNNLNMEVRVVLLPNRLDPDDYIRKYGVKKLAQFINSKWVDALEFQYIKNNMDIDFSKMLDIERFKKTVFDLIKGTSHTIIETYLNRLAEDTKLSVDSIRQDFEQYTKWNVHTNVTKSYKSEKVESKYERADRLILNYFLKDYRYVQDFGREFQGMFYLSDIVLSIRMVIEDLYFAIEEGQKKVISLKQVEEKLTEEQKKFLHEKVLYKKEMKLDQQEYKDFIQTLNEYLQKLQIESWNEEIKIAPTNMEKIKLAEYRDLKLKEVRKWTRK
jgi:DNA primase